MEFIIDADTYKGHEKYLAIMKMISDPTVDVSTDLEFQSIFSGYYFPSVIKQEFKKTFFDYMQENRVACLSYEKALRDLFNRSGSVHYSFASKLLHTLDPENPVLDKHIMRLMGFDLMDSSFNSEKRIKHYSDAFEIIMSEYQRYKDEPFMVEAIKAFDKSAGAFESVSYTKKVDMLMFRLRRERSVSVLDYLSKTH